MTTLADRYFDPLPTPAEMARWDAAAMGEVGIRPEVLMENASRECLAALKCEVGCLHGKRMLILAGSGNNGGDALALARHLHCEGAETLTLHTKPRNGYKGEAGYNMRLAAKLNLPMTHLPKERRDAIFGLARSLRPHVVVDGLLGTGFSGELRPDYLELVEFINQFRDTSYILAVDIPTGIEGESGLPRPDAVRAHATVTFEAAKTGLVAPEAAPYTGKLIVRAIGIPPVVKNDSPPRRRLMTNRLACLLPSPEAQGHKGSFGHVLVVGGSSGLTGAPMLAAQGAMRGGAGLVTIACPARLAGEIKASHPEIMILPLGDTDYLDENCLAQLKDEISRFDALAVGPGMGRLGGTAAFLSVLAELAPPPLVLDADALFHLAEKPELRARFKESGADHVLTPHPGEAARLLGRSIAEVQADRAASCQALGGLTGGAAVLKGAASLVCAEGSPVYVSPFSEPCLAVAGSGDVLTGLIAALLGRDMPGLYAATLGVYLHGFAGSVLARQYPMRGNLPLEIADALPTAAKELKIC